MKLISVDPGKHAFGWALFEDGDFIAGGLCGNDTQAIDGDLKALGATEAIIELPQVYQQRMWKGDPNDLIEVAIVAGKAAHALAMAGATDIEFVKPRVWKGTRSKKICNKLTLDTLTSCERAAFDTIEVLASLRHNVIDAIGIGLWRLKRR